MDEKDIKGKVEETRRHVTSITPDELDLVSLEAPIAESESFHDWELSALYKAKVQLSYEQGRHLEALVYGLFESLLDIHFKPDDRAEPFGPAWVLRGRRALIPQDLSIELAEALVKHATNIRHPIVRARVADIAWTVHRKLENAAHIAIDGYCASVMALRAGKLKRFDNIGDVTDYDVVDLMRRASQIALMTKGKSPFPPALATLISETRKDAFERKYLPGLYHAAKLDLDFAISPPEEIAQEAEFIVKDIPPNGDGHLPLAVLELASLAFRRDDDPANEDRMIIKAAEFCFAVSQSCQNAPMLEAHWLTRAIRILGRARSQKQRRNELRKCLIDVQARTLDDFEPIGTSIDIKDIVQEVQKQISGKSLGNALKLLILASKSPEPDKLRQHVQLKVSSSLASLFSTSVLDNEGKVKFKSPGMDSIGGDDNESQLRFEILQQEAVRRGLLVRSTLDPARAIIHSEHGITVEKLLPLVELTPFVQPDHEYVFAQGFARWFGGDVISGASILVPQLENSLRYILKNAGEDVTTMKNDDTQEDRSITAMFDQMRPEIEGILGEDITFEIENLFLLRAGPSVRHAIAHGQYSTGHFGSSDCNYACWFILQLCFLPLLSDWGPIENYLNAM